MSEIPVTGHTPWRASLSAQVSRFVRTESASSVVLVAAIGCSLLWSLIDFGGYEGFWTTSLDVIVGQYVIHGTLRGWLSSGLMSFFFLVVGAQARREFDLGALRDRRQFALPLVAGMVAMALPAAIYLLVNISGGAPGAWAVAMSTDTALALGLLSLVSSDVPERVRGFLLTLFIVDDLLSLVVIAVGYSRELQPAPLVIGVGLLVIGVIARRFSESLPVAAIICVAAWFFFYVSGVDPLVVGLVYGLTARAYVPARDGLAGAFVSFREFREQPTPRSARIAAQSMTRVLSSNERTQARLQPATSFLIVPAFAFANAGVAFGGSALHDALTSPVFWGIVLGYAVGKPIAVTVATWLAARLSRDALLPPVGWAAVAGTGTIAGVAFTVSILVAGIALHGAQLNDAKLAILCASLLAVAETSAVYRVIARLPAARRAKALLGRSELGRDLVRPVDPRRDHVRGRTDAAVTIVEYGDFECPFCGRAEQEVRQVLDDGEVRVVWRHLPIDEIHPHAELAAEAAEAAGAQDAFWEMHDLLLAHQTQLTFADIRAYAETLGLDVDRFAQDLREHRYRPRVREDVESGDASGVAGTPTFFINGQRHYGAYDADSLRQAALAAREDARLRPAGRGS